VPPCPAAPSPLRAVPRGNAPPPPHTHTHPIPTPGTPLLGAATWRRGHCNRQGHHTSLHCVGGACCSAQCAIGSGSPLGARAHTHCRAHTHALALMAAGCTDACTRASAHGRWVHTRWRAHIHVLALMAAGCPAQLSHQFRRGPSPLDINSMHGQKGLPCGIPEAQPAHPGWLPRLASHRGHRRPQPLPWRGWAGHWRRPHNSPLGGPLAHVSWLHRVCWGDSPLLGAGRGGGGSQQHCPYASPLPAASSSGALQLGQAGGRL
jgi:hypothetical protein